MKRRLSRVLVAASLLLGAASPAAADLCTSVAPVFTNDPCDPASGPLPMLPGLPLVLPIKGPTGHWSDGPPVINSAFSGDVDLAVRVGSFPVATEIPAPAGSTNNPSLLENIAGGGGSGQGSPVAFTVFVTDGPGVAPYGSPLAGLQDRPVAVFAFADLDGDGVIGPDDADGTLDNELEKQEALGHLGRQVGQIDVDRFRQLVAVRVGAPASIGGLRVALVAGMYTGDDPSQLWSNGTPIFTNWPFFPPLDPLSVVWLAEANPPDPNGPNILFYQPSEFLLPDSSVSELAGRFALPVDGSNPSTDQFVSVSGTAVAAKLFRTVLPQNYSASSRLVLRVAPSSTLPLVGPDRRLVTPAGEIAVESGQNVELRLLPVDSLGNVADPGTLGVPAKLRAEGGMRILAPDADGDPYAETLTLDSARGVLVQLSTQGVSGRAKLSVYDPPPAIPTGLDQAIVYATPTGAVDADDDGVEDDGDGSGTIGDRPCTAVDIRDGVACDDNCPNVVNPSQNDSDGDGQGNCCDGACVLDDADAGCNECPQAASRFQGTALRARLTVAPRAGLKDDTVKLRTVLKLQDGQALAPDGEQVEVTVAEGDRLHYFVQLPGVFTQTNAAPTWDFRDPDGNYGGIYRAQLRTSKDGVKARFLARAMNLVDTAPAEVLANGLVLAITIGDDTFTRHLRCRSSLQVIRCASTD